MCRVAGENSTFGRESGETKCRQSSCPLVPALLSTPPAFWQHVPVCGEDGDGLSFDNQVKAIP